METKHILALGILALTLSAVGLTVGYSLWSLSHISTGHVTITPAEVNPTGDFTVPLDIYFNDTTQGGTTTKIISITSTLNEDVTLTANSPGIDGVTVTAGPITLPAGATIDVILTLTASQDATTDYLSVPITFTVTQ